MHLPQPPEAPEWTKPRMFYGKPLMFNPRTHRYTWDGKHVPSVTTILSRLNKPALVDWAANCAVDRIREPVLGDCCPLTVDEWEILFAEARKAHTVIRDTAGDVGTKVHEVARGLLAHGSGGELVSSGALNEQAERALFAFDKWRKQHRIQPIDLERRVFSADMMYAGTTDFYGYIDDELAILDFKTGNGIYDEAWFQLAGYDLALTEELNLNNRPMAHWIVHLGKNSGECRAYRRAPAETGAAIMVWQHLVRLDKAIRAMPKNGRA